MTVVIGGGAATLRRAARFCLVISALTVSQTEAAEPLAFGKAFSDRNEPGSLHFKVRYRTGQQSHELEVWRKGQTQLRRVTDGVIETYAFRDRGDDPEFRMTVVDRRRRITTRIDRTNLYRVGNFTDWFDLAHGLKHPKQAYVIAKAKAPAGAVVPIDRCDWYRLKMERADQSICWSRKYRLPLLIYGTEDASALWQVTAVADDPISDTVYLINDVGYVKNDANRDIADD